MPAGLTDSRWTIYSNIKSKGTKKKKETGREGWSQKGKRNLVVAKEKLWGFLNVKYFGGKSELF